MKRFLKNTKLKLQLLRIWFFKNIFLFLEIIGVVFIILMLTGVIPEDAPVLGYIFGDLIAAINKIIKENDISQGVMAFFSAALSIISVVSMFTLKVKSIGINDIKSTKLKLALVQAGLYFNSDGRLVKRVEKATQTDINGDGKIADEETSTIIGGPIGQAVDAAKEFAIIVGTDFTKNDNVLSDTMEKANLTSAAEGQKELKENLITDSVSAVSDIGANMASQKITEVIKEGGDDETVAAKVSILSRVMAWFRNLPERFKKSRAAAAEKKAAKKAKKAAKQKAPASNKVEVIVNNADKDAKKIRRNKKQDEAQPKAAQPVKPEPAKPVSAPKSADDLINQILRQS